MAGKEHKTGKLKIWEEAKELKQKIYQEYVDSVNKGGIRVTGCTTMFFPLPAGLGEDVYFLTSDPYGANVGFYSDSHAEAHTAAERAGFKHELCSYFRAYMGSMLLNKFILPDGTIIEGFPKPHFSYTTAAAYCIAKWAQLVSEFMHVPLYIIDMPAYYPYSTKEAMEYVTQQALECIEWMEKVTKRKYNDELLIQAVHNECRSFRLWSEICLYNQNIPASLDEKTMFSLYVFNVLSPHRKEVVDFYERLRDEVRERAERGIGAVPQERLRLMSDGIPPWPYIQVWRYLEKEYGAVSIGSLYTFGLSGCWMLDENSELVPVPTPKERGIKINTREEAVRALVDFKRYWNTDTVETAGLMSHQALKSLVRQWKVDAAMIHLNHGCAQWCFFGKPHKLVLTEEAHIPVLTFEGSSADPRDFNLARTINQVDAFMESLGIKKLGKE